jgi:hypothetical protein
MFLSLSPVILSEKRESLPHLEKQGAASQLVVDNNPFSIIGGE